MDNIEYTREGFLISTDKARLDMEVIYDFIANQSYWGKGRAREMVETAIAHSLCFGVYAEGQQVGFARVVTDYATFGWLADVFVLPAYRGHGLGKWLVECVMAHPALQGMRMLLATADAHELYRRYGGFEPLPAPERFMVRPKRNP